MLEKILDYYTEQNLTNITLKIIEAYRNKKYSYIIGLAKIIDETIVDKHKNIQKLFSHLIMLFHPDRLNLYKKDISELITKNKFDELQKYEVIIPVLENLEKIPFQSLNSKLELEIEYEYGYDEEDFDSIIEENHEYFNESENTEDFQFDFISLLNYRELGSIDEDLPSLYFEELDGELDLSGSNLYDLSGLEKCINLERLDLSNNKIVDINQLGFLKQLKEINLSGNNIFTVDVLKQLHQLKHIDISFNALNDIRPLLNLANLKYLNVIENPIPKKQLELFKQKDIIFIY